MSVLNLSFGVRQSQDSFDVRIVLVYFGNV
jgi:hypothetical protein